MFSSACLKKARIYFHTVVFMFMEHLITKYKSEGGWVGARKMKKGKLNNIII